jgi:hypothetical protein
MLFKNSVRTSKRKPHFTITKINWLTLFKEIIAVYRENLTKHNTKCRSSGIIYRHIPADFKHCKKKGKAVRYTPWRRLGGEEV